MSEEKKEFKWKCPFQVGDLISDLDPDFPMFFLILTITQHHTGYKYTALELAGDDELRILETEKYFGAREWYQLVSRDGTEIEIDRKRLERWGHRYTALKAARSR